MGYRFWLLRFVVVYLGALAVIGAGQLLRGRSVEHAISHGLVWAAVTACVFIAARLYHSRKGRHCALCRDIPERPS